MNLYPLMIAYELASPSNIKTSRVLARAATCAAGTGGRYVFTRRRIYASLVPGGIDGRKLRNYFVIVQEKFHTTIPAVRLRIVPVIALPSSEATKTAALVSSSSVVSCLLCVLPTMAV